MGCASSSKTSTPPKIPHVNSEDGASEEDANILRRNNEEDKWRLEPQRALNQFVKNSADSEEYFSGENSMFDYFQDDEFVELRTMLDEPLGRAHFLAHVDHISKENADLVRLWLLLHKYHHIGNNNEERYNAAKNIYKHYFSVTPDDKAQAEAFLKAHPPVQLNTTAPSRQGDSVLAEDVTIEGKVYPNFEEYQRMLVPGACRNFPRKIISVILALRPTVEQALLEAFNALRGSPQSLGRRPHSSSLGCFVDFNPETLNVAQIPKSVPEGEPVPGKVLDDAPEGNGKQVDGVVGNQGGDEAGNKAAEEEEKPTRRRQLSTEERAAELLRSGSTDNFEESGNPPIFLFMDLQSEVFKEMRPLYQHFKDSEKDYTAYKESKKSLYNRVEPDDFEYYTVLGKGGFGHVVHVKKKSTGKHYAMKIQGKDTLLSTWGGKMQHVEIERDVLVAHRSFPFIVSLRYAFQDDKYAFLCLDLAEQGSLRQLLESCPGFQMEPPQVRLYVAELVLALECLHDHEIIYRDLKPENVLLCNDGHIMLADMGLAGFYYQDKYDEDEFTIGDSDDDTRSMNTNSISNNVDTSEMDDDADTSAPSSSGRNGDYDDDADTSENLSSGPADAGSGVMSRPSYAENQDSVVSDTTSYATGSTVGTKKSRNYRKGMKSMQSHDTDCGTPLYRPPEMVGHEEHYGEGVDWFMLGVFTYECLVGHLPFEPKGKEISGSGMIEIETDEQELKLLRRKVNIPKHLDSKTSDLLSGLLDLDQNTRLGVGPEEMKRDFQSLKDHGFFVGLGGPLAKKCDWEKVMNKEYKPVYIPVAKQVSEKEKKHASFDALVKSWKRSARKEAKEYAKRRNKKADYNNAPFVKEGKPIDPQLEHYFDNWDYLDSESINLEKTAARLKRNDNSNKSSTHDVSPSNSIRGTLSGFKNTVKQKVKKQKKK